VSAASLFIKHRHLQENRFKMYLCEAITECFVGSSISNDNVAGPTQLYVKIPHALSPSTEAHTAEALLSEMFASENWERDLRLDFRTS
jgi:hypothetical protein